jgi:hypothetical protein
MTLNLRRKFAHFKGRIPIQIRRSQKFTKTYASLELERMIKLKEIRKGSGLKAFCILSKKKIKME